MTIKYKAPAVVLALSIGLAGCSSGGNSTDTTTNSTDANITGMASDPGSTGMNDSAMSGSTGGTDMNATSNMDGMSNGGDMSGSGAMTNSGTNATDSGNSSGGAPH